MLNYDNMANRHKDDPYLQIEIFKINRFIQENLQGHVSKEPILPTDESTKLYVVFIVPLRNSNVARGHPPEKQNFYFQTKRFSILNYLPST